MQASRADVRFCRPCQGFGEWAKAGQHEVLCAVDGDRQIRQCICWYTETGSTIGTACIFVFILSVCCLIYEICWSVPEIFFLFNFYPEDSLLYSQRYPYSQSAFGVFCCVSSAHSLQKYTDEGNSSLDVMEGSSKKDWALPFVYCYADFEWSNFLI